MSGALRPLAGIRILAVEQYGAGPFASLLLADLGAEVIKIEDPQTGGDVARYVPPFQEGEDSLFFESFNRNKKSLGLAIATEAGREVFEALVGVSDAVYSNLRGDVPARLRLRYDDLKAVNPAIVCCSLSGFGMTGPRRREPAYDYILQGLAGWMSLTGEPGGPPAKSGLSLVDYCGGFVSALALVSGIHAARRDGTGMDCDLALFDTAVSLLTYVGTWYLTAGLVPERTTHSAHPSLVPFQNFQTTDGWIVVGCAKEKFWRRLAEAIGQPGLADDPRFADFAARQRHAEELREILGTAFLAEPSAHWIERLSRVGVPCGLVQSVVEALADPHTVARGLVVETDHPHWGRVRQLASPVRVGQAAPAPRRAPRRNEDGPALLGGLLGYGPDRIHELAARGAFGPLESTEEAAGELDGG